MWHILIVYLKLILYYGIYYNIDVKKEEKKNEIIQEKNGDLKIIGTIPDGNCVVRCYSIWLCGNQDKHPEVRENMVLNLIKNKHKYRGFVRNWELFLVNLAKNGSWYVLYMYIYVIYLYIILILCIIYWSI